MDNFNIVETRREEFRKYLDKFGVTQIISNILCHLFEEEERPLDPLLYVKKKLQEESVEQHEFNFLKRELETIRNTNDALKIENARLREEYNKLSDLHLIHNNGTNCNTESDVTEDYQ